MKNRILACTLLLGCFLALPSEAQWREGGKVVADEPWRKSAGKFGAMLLLTSTPDKFFEQWSKPPSPTYKPNITTVSDARRGDTVVAVVLFIGCAPAKTGNCDAEVDYRVLNPSGGVYGEQKGAELWKRAAPAEGYLQAGLGYLAMRIEPQDPLGPYVLEAVVRDKIAKVTVSLKQTLDVRDAEIK